MSLNNLAGLFEAQGDYVAARPLFERALQIRETTLGPTHPDVAMSLNNLAALLATQGDYVAARPLYERALQIRETTLGPTHPDVAMSLNNLAHRLEAQGDYVAARPLFERALQIWEMTLGPAHPNVATSLDNLALLLDTQGDYAAARPLYEHALQIRETTLGLTHPDVARSLNNLAALLATQGDYVAARPLYERALQIRETTLGPTHPDIAMSLNNLAILLEAQGDYAAARPLYERALQILESTLGPTHPDVATSLNNLAFLEWNVNNMPQARQGMLEAERRLTKHIYRVLFTLSFAEQRGFLETQIPIHTSVLLSICSEASCLPQAYTLILRWKGLLLEALRRQQALTHLSQTEPGMAPRVAQLQALRAQVAGWYRQAGAVPYDQWQQRYTTLTTKKEALERDLARALPAGTLTDLMEDIDFTEFQSLFAPDEAFLDVYRYNMWKPGQRAEIHYAVVLTPAKGAPTLIDLGAAEPLQQALQEWRTAVVRQHETADTAWQGVATLIWQPVVAALPAGIRKVWVSPDGELARIPWHLLPATAPTTQDWLLTQIASPRDFVARRRMPLAPDANATRTLLLVGGIDFNAEAFATSATLQGPWQRLPGTVTEVTQLHTLGQTHQFTVTLLTGAEASKAAVTAGLPQAMYAHLATHGFFAQSTADAAAVASRGGLIPLEPTAPRRVPNTRNPLVESGLVLAGGNVRDVAAASTPGLLTAEEVVGLDLRQTVLLTLSACDTGRGQETTGQGVLGLQAAFLTAGARSLLMSLWAVPDEATARLMQAFYTHLWSEGLPPAVALRRAQEAVRQEPRFAAPINWAAWVLVGAGW